MIVVDTSVWIDWIRNVNTPETTALNEKVVTDTIILGDLVLMEVLQGARDDMHARQLQRRLEEFPLANMFNAEIAGESATNYRRLRGLGRTVRSKIDIIIATFCIHHDHELLQSDRDFLPMAQYLGLRLA